jgi:anti-sigma regulatory factor (Ser/Thr protein kinase)
VGKQVTHEALLYDSLDQLVALAVPFVADGVRHSEAVLAVLSPAGGSALRTGLGSTADQVEFVDAAGWYDTPGRALAALHRFISRAGERHECVRIIGEPIWGDRDEVEIAEWVRYESALNLASADLPAALICSYNRQIAPPMLLAQLMSTHTGVLGVAGRFDSGQYTDPVTFLAAGRTGDYPPAPADRSRLVFGYEPRAVRLFVAAQAGRLGVAPERVPDLVTAVNEVVTNTIKHGAGHGEAAVWLDGDRVICEVTDAGQADAALLGYVPGGMEAEHGHGLWLAGQLADLMEVRAGPAGTAVRLHMRVTPR